MDPVTNAVLGLVGVSLVGVLVVAGGKVAQRYFGVGAAYTDDLEDELKLTRERYARIKSDLEQAQAALTVAQKHLDAANAEIDEHKRENDRLRAENTTLRGRLGGS